MRENKKSPVAAVCSALGTALLILLIILCIPFTVPGLLNYQAYAVVSGSMEPSIPTGSLVYVKEISPQNVHAGEIIAYYGGRDNNAIITHRVVENKKTERQFITKGDANQTEDMNPVDYKYFIGKVEVCIPKGGVAAQIFTSREGKIAAAGIIGAALLFRFLAVVLERRK